MAIRASMHRLGGVLLEKLLNADSGGHCGPRLDCGHGHQAEFVDYRSKQVLTVLAPVEVKRAYYHCADCQDGVIPKDRELDIAGTSFSPGVRRMMGRVGAKEPFEEGRQDLEELAGVCVKTKEVERVSEAIGEQIERLATQERELALSLSGQIVPIQALPKLYIAVDGTGVPMVSKETEGRAGKDETGRAKTREAKLGCVFAQTSLDDEGRPVRDLDSTTYVGAIETALEFGRRIYAEAVRRGVDHAERVVVLGDGAPWIWGLADEHFPGAIQIVDLYHVREHLGDLAKIALGAGSPESKAWEMVRREELDAGDVERVVVALEQLNPREDKAKDAVRKTLGYFQDNAKRMRYADFRNQGLFIGSGVVEAGCKTVVGHRLKQSGMRWTVRGANAIIALRCCELSGRWEQFWEARATA